MQLKHVHINHPFLVHSIAFIYYVSHAKWNRKVELVRICSAVFII